MARSVNESWTEVYLADYDSRPGRFDVHGIVAVGVIAVVGHDGQGRGLAKQ
jgi:hypothetical protein